MESLWPKKARIRENKGPLNQGGSFFLLLLPFEAKKAKRTSKERSNFGKGGKCKGPDLSQ